MIQWLLRSTVTKTKHCTVGMMWHITREKYITVSFSVLLNGKPPSSFTFFPSPVQITGVLGIYSCVIVVRRHTYSTVAQWRRLLNSIQRLCVCRRSLAQIMRNTNLRSRLSKVCPYWHSTKTHCLSPENSFTCVKMSLKYQRHDRLVNRKKKYQPKREVRLEAPSVHAE